MPIQGDKRATVYQARPAMEETERIPNDRFWLSESGDPSDVARSLFDLIQRLDSEDYSEIQVEMARDEGLGVAINDRLRRAASGQK